MNIQDLEKIIYNLRIKNELKNNYKLVYHPKANSSKTQCLEISFSTNLLLEFEQIKRFRGSKNRYFKHPEDVNIPCKAHYHIIGSKGNYEIYAVNMDGTAHHRQNKSYTIPKKEADELRNLGVTLRDDNIIEMIELSEINIILNENENENYNRLSNFILID